MTPEGAGAKPKLVLTPRGRKSRIPGGGRDTMVVLGLLAVAAGAVAAVLYAPRPGGAPRRVRTTPASLVPPRIPYRDIVRGRSRALDGGRVEILYDFEQARVENPAFATDADLFPQLDDWNRRIPGSRAKNAVVTGEGRFAGEARTRLAFDGRVEVAAELEVFEHPAAIQVCTGRAGTGYDCQIAPDGTVSLRVRRLRDEQKPEKGADSVDLCEPGTLDRPAAARRIRVVFSKTDADLRLEVDGVEALRAALPSPDEFAGGNVALRTTGVARWDDVRITGTLSLKWVEDRMAVAVRLTGVDAFDPDDSWSAAGELPLDGEEQERTFSPEGDVDWVALAVPPGTDRVLVETRDLHLGITTELAALDSRGPTPVAGEPLPAEEPGAARAVFPTRGTGLLYVRVSEPEGRVGRYRLRAAPCDGPAAPSP